MLGGFYGIPPAQDIGSDGGQGDCDCRREDGMAIRYGGTPISSGNQRRKELGDGVTDTLKTKTIAGQTLSVDLAARTVTHWVSRPTLDEDGEVLLPRGADISRFSRSSTVFDVHEYGSKNVVGSTVKGSWKVNDDGIVATTKFTERPPADLWPEQSPWEPDRLLWLYHTGDLKGWSIGFSPLEGRNPTKKDQETWGNGLRWVHTRYRVLEYSVAPLPCNSDALTLAIKGVMSKRLADQLAKGRMPTREELQAAPVIDDTKVCPKCDKAGVIYSIKGEALNCPACGWVPEVKIARRKVYIYLPPPASPVRQVTGPTEADMSRMIRRSIDKAMGKIYSE